MKLSIILALIAISVTVRGAFWAAAVSPMIVSLGALLTAFNLDVLDLDLKPTTWSINWGPD